MKAGDRVLVRLPNSIDYPTAFLGAMKLGAIAVPTSTLLTADEVRYLVEDSGAAALVIDRPAWESMKARLEGAVASVKASIEGVQAAVKGGGQAALKVAGCFAASLKAQAEASVSINVSVKASANASASAGSG